MTFQKTCNKKKCLSLYNWKTEKVFVDLKKLLLLSPWKKTPVILPRDLLNLFIIFIRHRRKRNRGLHSALLPSLPAFRTKWTQFKYYWPRKKLYHHSTHALPQEHVVPITNGIYILSYGTINCINFQSHSNIHSLIQFNLSQSLLKSLSLPHLQNIIITKCKDYKW